MSKSQVVTVLAGGDSPERDVSLVSSTEERVRMGQSRGSWRTTVSRMPAQAQKQAPLAWISWRPNEY
jgi:hypothetical protein